jgi:hypothetical protein
MIYFVSMAIVFILPNQMIQKNVERSIDIIDSEGEYPIIGSFFPHVYLDNWTDKFMMEKTIKSSSNPLYAAIDLDGVGKMWNGYLVFLRPLLLFFDYNYIRYLNIFIFLTLIFIASHLLEKKLGVLSAVSFLISLGMCHIYIVPYSMQFSSVFIIMIVSVILMCIYAQKWSKNEAFLFFIIIASITNFINLLTSPLMTLTCPLAVYYFMKSGNRKSIFDDFVFILRNTIAWFVGYASTWIIKWVFLMMALGPSVMAEQVGISVVQRLGYREGYRLDRIYTLLKNIYYMVNPKVAIMLAFVAILWLVAFKISHKEKKNIFKTLPILGVCIYPYIWYIILPNHSEVHAWFTYTIQIGTAFTSLLFLSNALDFVQIKDKILNRKNIAG